MNKNIQRVCLVAIPAVVTLFSGLLLSGCGKAVETITEKAIESEMGGDADVDIDSTTGQVSMKMNHEGNEVSMEAGESVSLPADMPADVPLPDGVTWNLVQNTTGESNGFILQGTVDTAMADLAATLRTKIEAQGWESVQNISQAGAMEMMTYSKGEKTLTYNLATDGGKTTVMIALG